MHPKTEEKKALNAIFFFIATLLEYIAVALIIGENCVRDGPNMMIPLLTNCLVLVPDIIIHPVRLGELEGTPATKKDLQHLTEGSLWPGPFFLLHKNIFSVC